MTQYTLMAEQNTIRQRRISIIDYLKFPTYVEQTLKYISSGVVIIWPYTYYTHYTSGAPGLTWSKFMCLAQFASFKVFKNILDCDLDRISLFGFDYITHQIHFQWNGCYLYFGRHCLISVRSFNIFSGWQDVAVWCWIISHWSSTRVFTAYSHIWICFRWRCFTVWRSYWWLGGQYRKIDRYTPTFYNTCL